MHEGEVSFESLLQDLIQSSEFQPRTEQPNPAQPLRVTIALPSDLAWAIRIYQAWHVRNNLPRPSNGQLVQMVVDRYLATQSALSDEILSALLSPNEIANFREFEREVIEHGQSAQGIQWPSRSKSRVLS